jgi:ubiquitin C-terminal hydrolase
MSKGMIGLGNLGNTCYANAALQALRHQTDLTMFLFQNKHREILEKKGGVEKADHHGKFVCAYADLIHQMWNGEGPAYVRPEGFWQVMLESAVRAGFDHFNYRAPHDSQEFLMFVLDEIHEGLKEKVTMTIAARPRPPLAEEGIQTWKKFFENQYSPLVELVFTLQLNTVRCEECSSEFYRWETNNMFKCSVPEEPGPGTNGSYTLVDLMKRECVEENIDEYACDKCSATDTKKRTKAKKQHAVWRMGNWVIVVLKRNSNSGRRINTPVDIPMTQVFGDVFHSQSPETSRTGAYDLFAVINHHGGANGGHYTAQAKNPLTSRWNLFDDESVHELADGPSIDASAYIVFYRLKGA